MKAPTNLDYNGSSIRVIEDRLSLTDMWKAAGSPANKEPYEWQRLPYGTEFINDLAVTTGKSRNKLIMVKAGRGGGTWAHWQIGLAYAKDLSTEFHFWCNTVVRSFMEGELVPADAVKASNILMTLDPDQQRILGPVIHFMAESFAKIFEQQHDIRELVSGVQAEIEDLRSRVPQRRREIKPETRQRHIAILIQLGCRCPCCGSKIVVSASGDVLDGAEFDHYYANQLASDDHTWLICKPCHDALTQERMTRSEATPHFMSFQLRRAALQTSQDASAKGTGDNNP